MYYELNINDKILKLRLRAKDCVALERKLGKNPLSVFMGLENNNLPRLEDLILILQYSLQAFEHGYNEDKTYELYDEYIEAGNTIADFLNVIMEAFKVSGLIPDNQNQEEEKEDNNNLNIKN